MLRSLTELVCLTLFIACVVVVWKITTDCRPTHKATLVAGQIIRSVECR